MKGCDRIMVNNPNKMTANQLIYAIKNRHIGIEELINFYLYRISKYDGINGLNTIAEIDETVIKQARAMDVHKTGSDLPLYGLPILVKDNIDVCGLHTTAESLALLDNIASKDAPIIANLKKNGAIILGKTNMTEFANYTTQGMPCGYSSRGGQVKNAYDKTKSPGGSSSGSAVAVSAGFCAAAVGTDTSFSVVGCATDNGVTGLKPPVGILSSVGIIPIAHTLDSAGALTKDFSDAYMLYSGMCKKPLNKILPLEEGALRIAVNVFNQDQVSEAQLKKHDTLFNRLKDEGATFAEISQEYVPYQQDIMSCEFRKDLEEYLHNSNARLKYLSDIVNFYESNPEQMMRYGITYLKSALNSTSGGINNELYLKALAERKKLKKQVLKQLQEYDVCIMTGPTNIMHFTGLPSVALRLGMAEDNTPRGIILYGSDEVRLYSAALTIEKYCQEVTRPKL
ncbi:amidase family protein [Paludicola sp. MB14-C6]|uniref:amidase family protein n=1 Tax=Paludihabitans sp. MB14-C6 TaxID=3070656 RepID=UPI0027DE5EDA|nr:amidase family protein [Paludicola sp. MB14-C6]WMJ23146.1 amidase family protein [Paludicola sp. MB14-C6]